VTTEWKRLVGVCEVTKYKVFRDAFFLAKETRETNLDKIRTLMSDNEAAMAAPGSGKKGARCEKPRSNGDGKRRGMCADGLCCGSASKKLDGALVTIETCQTATETSFSYVRKRTPMEITNPAGAPWDFVCIGGAQRMLAAAAAVAGLGLMMQ